MFKSFMFASRYFNAYFFGSNGVSDPEDPPVFGTSSGTTFVRVGRRTITV